MHSVTAAQARQSFSAVLTHARSEPVEITRHGTAAAYIVSAAMFDKLTQLDATHLFAAQQVTPASITIDQLAAVEPAPGDGGEPLSVVVGQLRQERL